MAVSNNFWGDHVLAVTYRKRKINVWADPKNDKRPMQKFYYQPLFELENDLTIHHNELLQLVVSIWNEELEEKINEALGSIYQSFSLQMIPLEEVKLEWKNPPLSVKISDDPISFDHSPMEHTFTVSCFSTATAKRHAAEIRQDPRTLARGLHVTATNCGQQLLMKVHVSRQDDDSKKSSDDVQCQLHSSTPEMESTSENKKSVADVEESFATSLCSMHDNVKQYHDNMENRFTHLETRVDQLKISDEEISLKYKKLEADFQKVLEEQRKVPEENVKLGVEMKVMNDSIKELKNKLSKMRVKEFSLSYKKEIVADHRQDYMTVIPPEHNGGRPLLVYADCRKAVHVYSFNGNEINLFLQNNDTIRGLGTSGNGRLYILVCSSDGISYLKQFNRQKMITEDNISDVVAADFGSCHTTFVMRNDIAYLQTESNVFLMPIDTNTGLVDRASTVKLELPQESKLEWINSFDVNDNGDMFFYCYRRRRLLYLNSECALLDGLSIDLPDLPFKTHLVFPRVLSESQLLLSVSPQSPHNGGALILIQYDKDSFQESKILAIEKQGIPCDIQVIENELAVRHYNRSTSKRALRLYDIN